MRAATLVPFLVAVIIAGLAFALACERSGANVERVEKLVHTPLRDRANVHAAYGELGDGDNHGVVYGLARFDSDDAGFVAFCRDLRAEPSTGHGYLPATWSWPLEGSPPAWWRPAQTTPEMACARPYGRHGWIAAKLEASHVFLILTEAP